MEWKESERSNIQSFKRYAQKSKGDHLLPDDNKGTKRKPNPESLRRARRFVRARKQRSRNLSPNFNNGLKT